MVAVEHISVAAEHTFSLAGRGLKLDSAADMVEHAAAIAAHPRVEKIVLSGNTIGVDAAAALADAIRPLAHLRVLDLSDIFTGRLRAEIPLALTHILSACLHKKPLLAELNLSDNAFGPAGADPLAPFLVACPTLEILHLNNNGLGVTGGSTIARALIERSVANKLAEVESSLRVVVAGRNRLENGSAALLAEAFRGHAASLEIVRLPQNGIRPEGIVAIVSDGLSHCCGLKWLDVQDNTLTAAGSLAVANAITAGAWPHLSVLNLSDALLGSDGGAAICDALSQNTPAGIEIVNLGYGEITERAIQKLAPAISKMPALAKLELNGNQFSEDGEGVEMIRKALAHLGKDESVLGELDDMEEVSEAEEEEEEVAAEKEAVIEQQAMPPLVENVDDAIDALSAAIQKTRIV